MEFGISRRMLQTTTLTENFANWFCNEGLQSYEAAKDASGGASLNLPNVGKLNLSSDSNSSGSGFASYKHCGKSSLRKNFARKIDQEFRKANPDIINAWTKCRLEKGFKFWVSPSFDIDKLKLGLQFEPVTTTQSTVRINDIDINEQVIECKLLQRRIRIGPPVQEFGCTRKPYVGNKKDVLYDGTQITITTYDGVSLSREVRTVYSLPDVRNIPFARRIHNGEKFWVMLNGPDCPDDSNYKGSSAKDPLGNIKCGETYEVAYTQYNGKWPARGYNQYYDRIDTWTYEGGDPNNYLINIWGHHFRFTDQARVIDQKYGFVGHLIFGE